MDKNYKNRRKFHRINLEKRLDLCLSDEKKVIGRIKNLSLGGMLVTGKMLPNPEKNCIIKLYYHENSDKISIKASATVIWANEQEAGLKFTSMSNDSYMFLLRTLIKNAKQPAIILHEFPKSCPFEIEN